MWQARRQTREIAARAEALQAEWVGYFPSKQEMRAMLLLERLADYANAKFGATAGDTAVIAVEALKLYERKLSVKTIKDELGRRYDRGSLRSAIDTPLNQLVDRKGVVALGLSALVNARPETKADIERLGGV